MEKILRNFTALFVGRPKAWEFNKPNSEEEKKVYKEQQRKAFIDTFREYNPTSPIVLNMDFGHTDPQIALPVGRKVKVDPSAKKIWVKY